MAEIIFQKKRWFESTTIKKLLLNAVAIIFSLRDQNEIVSKDLTLTDNKYFLLIFYFLFAVTN